MLQNLLSILKKRYKIQWEGLSFSIKMGVLGLVGQFSFGLIYDSWPYPSKLLLASFLIVVVLIMIVEAASLFEFRGVELQNYTSWNSTPERDRLIGRIANRLLLGLGNITMAYSLCSDIFCR